MAAAVAMPRPDLLVKLIEIEMDFTLFGYLTLHQVS